VATRKRVPLAKLSRPRSHDAMPRERLFAILDGARQRTVVWVSGPPGAGKTTLIASYLDARKLHSIWYHLDASDGDIGAFFHYLSLAAEALKPKWDAMPVPYAEVMSDPIGFGRGFFREFFALASNNLVLVLDNYQEVPEQAALHTILRNAIEDIPEGIQLLVISRALPPNQFARHRTHGNIFSIGFSELKLTLDEAIAVARKRGFTDTDAVGMLHGQTDGWFAGLTLLIEHAARVGTARALKTESLEGTFQYFAGEIFDAAPPEQQQTLMQTAFLPVMTAHTAERISANPNAHKILEQLHQRQLFVERRPGEETTYQYHALFREFLLSRAREIFTPVGLRQLARRAADLLRESGNSDKAIDLLLEAQDWGAAKSAILELAPILFASSRWTTLSGWIAKLPQAEVESNGWLQFWQGSANFAQQPLLAEEQLGKAYENLKGAGDQRGQILTCSAVLRAYHSNIHGEFPTVGTWISRLANLLKHSAVLEPAESVEVHGSLLMAFQYHDPSNPFRAQCSARLVGLLLDKSIALERKGYAAGMAINYLLDEQQKELQDIIFAVRPLLEKPAPQSVGDLYLWYYYALYCQAMGDFVAARHHIDKVVALADSLGTRRMAITSRWFQHINCIQARDIAGLEVIRERILPKGDEGKAIHLMVFHNVTASILLLRGDAATAIQHLESSRRAAHTYRMPLHEAAGLVALAATHYEQGSIAEAAMFVDQGRKLTANSAMVTEYLELTMIGALASEALKRDEQARAYLTEVFAKGLPLFWAIFHTPNNVPAKVCALALREQIAVPAAIEMIKRYQLRAPSPDVLDWPWPIRIRTLGEFAVLEDGGPARGGRKIQRKPLELLKALIAFACVNVDTQRLAEAVWPELDGDAAMAALHAALLRLRKLLKHDGLLQLHEGKLSLDLSRCWVDTQAIEHMFVALEGAPEGTDARTAGSLLALYRGDFLAREEEKPWILPTRERLRRRFLSCVALAGDRLEALQDWTAAIGLYERALAASNLSEDMYRRLMRCFVAQGRHAEAIDTYRRCRELLSVVLSTKPSVETDVLYQQIRQQV
jgi:LuxR family transcriptional regulator, maltose regulon positive regulatory protein